MSRLPVVNVGVLGLGTDWQSRYLPALLRMQQRLRIIAVHDEVATRAEVAAQQLKTRAISSIRELLDLKDVDAWLFLGAEWRAGWLVEQLRARALSVFVGRDIAASVDQLRDWHQRADEEGLTVFPESPLRFTPATLRLRELMATELGSVVSMNVKLRWGMDCDSRTVAMVHLVDSFRALLQRELTDVEQTTSHGSSLIGTLLSYTPRRQVDSVSQLVPVALSVDAKHQAGSSETPEVTMEFTCQQGTAVLRGPDQLDWSVNGKSLTEKLHSDRSSAEVMFDLFARRVVGGLIPAPDLTDRIQAMQDAGRVHKKLSEPMNNTASVKK